MGAISSQARQHDLCKERTVVTSPGSTSAMSAKTRLTMQSRPRSTKNIILAINGAKLGFKQDNDAQLYGKYTAVIAHLGIPSSASKTEAKKYVE
jgi:hypothetical protein